MNEFLWKMDQYHIQNDMIDWCEKNIGPGGWYGYINNTEQLKHTDQWGCWWTLGGGRFVFRTEDQLNSFVDAWSNK